MGIYSSNTSIFIDGKDIDYNFLNKIDKIKDFLDKNPVHIENYFIKVTKTTKNLIPSGIDYKIAYDFFEIDNLNTIPNIKNKLDMDIYVSKNTKEIKAYINDISNIKTTNRYPSIRTNRMPHIIIKDKNFFTGFNVDDYNIGIKFEKDANDIEYAFFNIYQNSNINKLFNL